MRGAPVFYAWLCYDRTGHYSPTVHNRKTDAIGDWREARHLTDGDFAVVKVKVQQVGRRLRGAERRAADHATDSGH